MDRRRRGIHLTVSALLGLSLLLAGFTFGEQPVFTGDAPELRVEEPEHEWIADEDGTRAVLLSAEEAKSGELTNADSVHFADSLKFETLREHRTVYGGGGIMPDYYVPLDTTLYTQFHRELAAKSIVIQSNLRFVDNHRKQLKKRWESFDDFKKNFTVPQSLVDEILAEGKKQKIEPKNQAELEKTLPYLRLQLKALIARDLWDMSEYFSVFNEQNEMIKKALEVIRGQ